MKNTFLLILMLAFFSCGKEEAIEEAITGQVVSYYENNGEPALTADLEYTPIENVTVDVFRSKQINDALLLPNYACTYYDTGRSSAEGIFTVPNPTQEKILVGVEANVSDTGFEYSSIDCQKPSYQAHQILLFNRKPILFEFITSEPNFDINDVRHSIRLQNSHLNFPFVDFTTSKTKIAIMQEVVPNVNYTFRYSVGEEDTQELNFYSGDLEDDLTVTIIL